MPIHRERYRRRDTGVDVRGRAWIVIALNGLRLLLRRRAFLFLLILGWIPAVVRAVQIYAAANVPGMAQIDFLTISGTTFRDFLNQQDSFVFFITVYAGSGLIADDLRARALQLYLSRPVTRTQYVAGKATILMSTLLSVTWLPAMLLLLLVPVFSGSMTFLIEHAYLVPAISAYTLAHATLATFLMLALSSTSRSRWFVAVMYAGVSFFTHAVSGVIAAAVPGTTFSWVSIFSNVKQIGDLLFRVAPRYDTPPLVSAVVIVAVITLSGYVLSRRIRAVEVVT